MSKLLTICSGCNAMNGVDRVQAKTKKPICGKCQAGIELHGLVSHVNEANLNRILNKATELVIVDFWASWCGPCKVYGPIFEQTSLEAPNAIFLKISTEEEQAISQRLGIRGIPATIIFKNGKEVARQAGVMQKEQILQMVNSAV